MQTINEVFVSVVVVFRNCSSQNAFFSDIDFSCDTGAVRLSLLSSNGEDILGRLEVCYDGYWGSVCNDLANNMTALVACRQLGHRQGICVD